MKKILIITILVIMIFSIENLTATVVNDETIEQVASNWYNYFKPIEITEFFINSVIPIEYEGESVIRIITFNPIGYVIITSDDNCMPILGYSHDSDFDSDNLPDAYLIFQESYHLYAKNIIENQIYNEDNQNRWHEIIVNDFQRFDGETSVDPLLETAWGQSGHYNDYCPIINGNQTLVGCVAVAMGQIMKYWNYPAKGTGDHTIPGTNYSANFGETNYLWNKMGYPDLDYDAIAELLFHCGVSVDMDYGVNSSSAYSEDVESGIQNYFGYDNDASFMHNCAWNEVMLVLLDELDELRPVYYSACDGEECHAFVCDGYQTIIYFHFNWGWCGYMNGYFYISLLPYYINNKLVYEIYPEHRGVVGKIEIIGNPQLSYNELDVEFYNSNNILVLTTSLNDDNCDENGNYAFYTDELSAGGSYSIKFVTPDDPNDDDFEPMITDVEIRDKGLTIIENVEFIFPTNLLSGFVTLNGSGSTVNTDIIFFKYDNTFIEHPDYAGMYYHCFSYDEFGTYDITYELFNAEGDYYPITIEDYEITQDTQTLPNVTLNPIISNDLVLVSTDPQNHQAFHNIRDAVSYLQDNGGGTVNVLPGIYTGSKNEDINWIPWDYVNNEEIHIKIKGLPTLSEQCIIDCEGGGIAFIFDDYMGGFFLYNNNDGIENLVIQNAWQGIVIENGSPVIRNNIIENCETYMSYDDFLGVGISCKSSATIEDNIIQNNMGRWWGNMPSSTYGGGIYIENNSESPAIIRGNTIFNNCARHGGAIYCTGDGDIIIDDNWIEGNYLIQAEAATYSIGDGIGIYCYNCNSIEITNNIVVNNNNMVNIREALLIENCSNINIRNNTIVNNSPMKGIKLINNLNCSINNSIIMNNGKGIHIQSGQPDEITITYSCVYGNTVYNYSSLLTLGVGCFEEDPEINLGGDNPTYQPIWNVDGRSPCIDTGDPASPFDPDDTPCDIGAVRAITHKYDTIELPSPLVDNGWKWLSFPALDTVFDEADIAENVLADIMASPYPAILDKVVAQDYVIEYDFELEEWENDWRQFLRTEGFKFHMNDDFTLDVPGFKVADNTTIVLEGNNAENWVGYWLDETQHVSDAFSDYWSGSNINFIQHQKWTAFYLGRWRIMLYGCEEPTLSYGDMVVVKCNTTINNFHWISGTPVEKTVFAKPEYFTFEEQADYTPLYIELDSGNMPQEIGAFVDGECIGAVVVGDTLTQINAYTTSVPPGNIELELYYGGRSENQNISSYNCVTSSNPNIVLTHLSTKKIDDAWFIDLREDSSMTPTPKKMKLDNYPNPFNPTTTIAYGLPLEGKVSLNIYNIKGQLVRQLINGSQPEGYYEVVWNGKDNNEKNVSSGIYFYKLSTKDETIMKKMLMLK